MARQDNQAIPEMETSPRNIGDEDQIRSGSDEEIRDIAEEEDEFDETDDLENEEEEEEDEGSV